MRPYQIERIKLSALYVNGLAVAVFAVGGLAPLFSGLYSEKPGPLPFWATGLISSVCFLASLVLHLVARDLLKRLR